jgi:hypothetical protein
VATVEMDHPRVLQRTISIIRGEDALPSFDGVHHRLRVCEKFFDFSVV